MENDIFTSTASNDLGMYCDKDWQKSFAQSLYMAGMLVGSFVFGFIADHIGIRYHILTLFVKPFYWITGRKMTLAITSLLLAGSGSACALLPASADIFPAFAALRFLMGVGHVGSFMMAFTLSLEYVGPKARVMCGCIIEVPFAVGKKKEKKISPSGNRTPVSCVTGRDTYHYTNED